MKFYKLNKEATFEDIKKLNYQNYKLGVIIYIEDKNNNILLQQRGIKASDQNGLYECVGGKFEKEDKDFKTAIIREINEEMGTSVNIKINNSTGIAYFNLNNTSHIFIIYYGKYIDGKIEIMEPDKCMNYKFFTYEEAINSNMVTKECKFLINNIKKYQSAIY